MTKEVKAKIVSMVERELGNAKRLLRNNKYEINKLAKEQRTLKATTGELYKLLKSLNP